MDISSFHAVQKLINRVSVEEYTDNVLKKVEQYGDVVIEQDSTKALTVPMRRLSKKHGGIT